MCCLQNCEEHYLDLGVTDKKTGGGEATDISRQKKSMDFLLWPGTTVINYNFKNAKL